MSRPVSTPHGDIWISEHAIHRYIERVKPAYSYKHAHWEMCQLLLQAEKVDQLDWHGADRSHEDQEFFLVLCDSIAFPIQEGGVTTTICRATFTRARDHRLERQRERRRRRSQKAKENAARARRERKAKGIPKPGLDEAA